MHIHLHLLVKKERLSSNPTPRKSAQRPKSNKKTCLTFERVNKRSRFLTFYKQIHKHSLGCQIQPYSKFQTSLFFVLEVIYSTTKKTGYILLFCLHYIYCFPNLHDIFFWGDFSNIRTSPNSKTLTPQKQGSVVSIARLQQHSTYRQEGHRTQGLQGLLPT